MGRVLTQNVNLAYTIESSLGTAGTTWYNLEPNSIGTFGATITTVARQPINKNRQRQKGTVTDLDSAIDFEADLTISSFRDFIEGFCFVNAVNRDVTELASTAAETTGDTYTIAALSAAQAEKFEISTLIWAAGFALDANNGLKSLDTDAASTDTTLAVSENLADEASPPSGARISFAGYRIPTGDTVTWDWDATEKQATLSDTGLGTLLTQLGLTVGQFVHVGSPDGSGGVTNAFENAAANDMYGYARVVSIAADAVVFDKVDSALQYDDLTDPTTAVDLLFGEFIRNVDTSDTEYLERSFQFEAEFKNLDAPNDEYQYSVGNYCNTVTFNLPLTEKATAAFSFIGTDTENPVTSGSRKSGASSATNPLQTSALNTSADIARLRITEVDETGISTDFKSVSIALNNNVSPEKVLGTLGAKYMNTGNFEVDVTSQLLFTDGAVVNKIRDNETVTMDFIVTNSDGAIAVDIPSMTLGDGSRDFPVNESVLINTKGMAFQDPTLGTSIGVSIFPVVP
jgi:Phage tail tube protein